MEREIRRNRNNLIILGTGALAFAAWTVIRSLAQYVLQKADLEAMISKSVEQEYVNNVMNILLVVIIVSLAVDLLLRMYVGLSARAEGKGKKRRIAYLIAAVIIAVLHGVNIGMYISIIEKPDDLFECIIGIVIEVTAAITIIELIIASVRLRRLTAQEKQ